MDIRSNQLTTTASPSSSSPPWDVFLSFSGKDTRNNFTAHLYEALHQSAIRTYKDDPELERGQEISSGLFKAIQDSKVSIVVLSNNFARSSWCLDELVEILVCKKTKGLVIHPVFYHVDPSNVRYQKDSFGEALLHHKKHYLVDKIDKWRDALTEISHLSGDHIKDANVNEADSIKQILKAVKPLVSTKALDLEEDHLVGIDSAIEDIYEILSMQSTDAVRAIGICGMGGIGKTTIAKAFHNKYCEKFDCSCFVKNDKRTLQGSNNLLFVVNDLLAQLLDTKDYSAVDVKFGIRKLNEIFSSRKVLLVLDDFDESSDLEILIRCCNSFVPGSTIIVTTRDQQLLNRLKIRIHMVYKLAEKESLELFSYHAFGTTNPPEDFKYLSKSYVEYVDGVPLALKVLGSSLKVKDLSLWKEKVQKVQKIPENKIHEILKLSYDELSDRTVKDIFLDVVFFFVGKEKGEAVWVFESCGFFPHNGIQILLERCLLTVKNNKLEMHNLIQNMGWEVIEEETKEPWKRKRLVCKENAFELFKYKEGVEALILDFTSWTKKDLSASIFEVMPKLRLLEIVNAPHDLKISFENSFQELRCIRWHYCPWTRLPSSFRPQKLILLDMQFSNFKTLWKGSLPLENLRSINVSYSECLKTIPDLNKVKRLEKLSLRCCWKLLKFQKSFLQLSKLSHLDLSGCRNLERLPQTIGQLDGLRNLDLGGCHILKGLPDSIKQLTGLSKLCLRECYKLTQLPEFVGNMNGLEVLIASYTNIEQLPDSICQLRHLHVLVLCNCKMLRDLPEHMGNMKGLEVLDASDTSIEQLPDSICELSHLHNLALNNCKMLRDLPEHMGNMKGLRKFRARSTAIRQLPDSFEDLINLCNLSLDYCRNLKRLPKQLGKMQSLETLHAYDTAIEELPESIAQLSKLRILSLNLSGCEKLREIPDCSWNLTSFTDLELKSIEGFPESIKDMKGLERLRLRCNIRSYLPTLLCLTSLTELGLIDAGESLSSSIKPFSLSNLSKLEDLRLEGCKSVGSCLHELPLNLQSLAIWDWESLEQLLDLSTFIRLTTLCIVGCNSLESLPLLPPHLENLYIIECRSIRDTHDQLTTSNLKDLKQLKIRKCSNFILNAEEGFFQALKSSTFDASISMKTEIPNWVGNKRKGSMAECVVPQMLSPNNSLYILFWLVYNFTPDHPVYVRAVITNKADGTTHYPDKYFLFGAGSGSHIGCLYPKGKYYPGIKLKVSFETGDWDEAQFLKIPDTRFKVKKCGIHLMYK